MRSKAISVVSILVVAVSLAIGTADAQSIQQITVNIPFDFNVTGKAHPAGKYVITWPTYNREAGFLLIRSARGNDSEVFRTMGTKANRVQFESKLVFNRYEDRYFLAQIWTGGDDGGRRLLMTAAEGRVKRELARRGLVAETVVTAANVE
jgi:hypothetical protein